MRMYQKKRLTHILLLFVVLVVALSFTAVAQARGGDQPAPPAKPPMGKPPMGKPPGAMPPPTPELANCIEVVTFFDGNLNGIVDGNEDPMDGASVVLMAELPPPPEDPPIGPDGTEMTMHKPPMGPAHGGPMPPGKRPMGPPPGSPMAKKPMPGKGFAKFQVLDRKITRDGGIAVFCDLKPGAYILQGDAYSGITYGDTRQYVELGKDGYQIVFIGFTSLSESFEPTNGNDA